MLEQRHTAIRRHRRAAPPFPRVVCAVDGTEATDAAIDQAIAVAGGDSRVMFAASWYGQGSRERALASEKQAREAVAAAVTRAREAGVEAQSQSFHAPRLGEALLSFTFMHDLVVVGAHLHTRATGILLGEDATLLVHRCEIPVLVARPRPLANGIVAAARALPEDRAALTTGARLAARLGAELTVVHVAEGGDDQRRRELRAELANARALLGRELDYYREFGNPARAIVVASQGDGAGLVVVGSSGRRGLSALASVSERVTHLAPCSVLVMRGR
jgi:nucleotide-binding universal stress UspA family protein